ncbi:MAG: DUF1007 family protein, partial [Deltaproteobacteria bacterium]
DLWGSTARIRFSNVFGTLDGAPIALAPHQDISVSFAGGRLTTTHTRALETPVDLTLHETRWKTYDPWFYAAITLLGGAQVEGAAGCSVATTTVDQDAAWGKVDTTLFGPGSQELSDAQYPQIGEDFADEVSVTCASG